MKYSIKYFLAKFEAIPEEKWCCEALFESYGGSNTKKCALGHCNVSSYDEISDEARALADIFPPDYSSEDWWCGVAYVNDGLGIDRHLGTPRQRILNALRQKLLQCISVKECK